MTDKKRLKKKFELKARINLLILPQLKQGLSLLLWVIDTCEELLRSWSKQGD